MRSLVRQDDTVLNEKLKTSLDLNHRNRYTQGISFFLCKYEDALYYEIIFCERVVGETGTKYKKPVLIDLIFTLTAPVQFFKVAYKQMAEQ